MNVFFAIHDSDMFTKSIHPCINARNVSFVISARNTYNHITGKTLGLFNEMTKFGATRPPLLNITQTF